MVQLGVLSVANISNEYSDYQHSIEGIHGTATLSSTTILIKDGITELEDKSTLLENRVDNIFKMHTSLSKKDLEKEEKDNGL